MLNHAVQNTADTKGRLNDVGSVLANVLNTSALLNVDQLLVQLNLTGANTLDIDLDLAVVVQVKGELLAQLLGESINGSLDGLGVLLEAGTELLLLEVDLPLLNAQRLSASLANNQRSTGLVLVHGQIVSTAVSAANTFNPAVAGVQLSIPAVLGVVSHLVGHVLTETELCEVNTNLGQEELDTGEEVTQSLVVDEASLNSLSDGHRGGLGATRQLDVAVKQGHLNVLDLGEAGVLLATLGVDVVLNLSHEELTDTQKTGARRNLVTERLANGGRGEGHALLVELEQLLEVQELSLGSLRAKVAGHVAAGTNGSLEHEVEGDGGLHGTTGGGVANVVLDDDLLEIGAVEVVDLGEALLVLLHESIVKFDSLGLTLGLLLLLGLLLGIDLNLMSARFLVTLQARLEHLLDQVVGTEDLAGLGVLAHPVGELVHVPGGLENLVGGEHAAVDLKHILLEHEVLAPCIGQVGDQSGTGRAIVIETRDTTVDLEGGGVEHAAAEHGVQHEAVDLLTGLGFDGGHLGIAVLLLERGRTGESPSENRWRGKKRAGGNAR